MQGYYKDSNSNSNFDQSEKQQRQLSGKKNTSSKKMSLLNSSFNSYKDNKNDSFYRKNKKKDQNFSENFKVVIRVRPPSDRELSSEYYLPNIQIGSQSKCIQIKDQFDFISHSFSKKASFISGTIFSFSD